MTIATLTDSGRIATADDDGTIDLGPAYAGEEFIVTRRADGAVVLVPLSADLPPV